MLNILLKYDKPMHSSLLPIGTKLTNFTCCNYNDFIQFCKFSLIMLCNYNNSL